MAWTAQEVVVKMLANDMELCKCIVAIYRQQTTAEQNTYTTRVTNGVGFNKVDATILTSFAKQIIANKRRGKNRFLSDKQIATARRKMPKYAKQLAKIANGEL